MEGNAELKTKKSCNLEGKKTENEIRALFSELSREEKILILASMIETTFS